jgi:hypothetical protein
MSEAVTFVATDEPGALEIVGSNPTGPTMIKGPGIEKYLD